MSDLVMVKGGEMSDLVRVKGEGEMIHLIRVKGVICHTLSG